MPVQLHPIVEAANFLTTGPGTPKEKIILGGPISIAGDFLLPSIKQSVNKRAMHEIVIQTEINISAFGTDASVIGAVAVVVNDILTNPTHIEKEVVLDRVISSIVA